MSNVHVARLPERFDFGYHKEFNQQMDKALDNKEVTLISLDFSAVNYLDSAALGMIVYLHKKAASVNKKIQITNASGTAAEILKVANIEKLVAVQ